LTKEKDRLYLVHGTRQISCRVVREIETVRFSLASHPHSPNIVRSILNRFERLKPKPDLNETQIKIECIGNEIETPKASPSL
jgi:hypothetical protein